MRGARILIAASAAALHACSGTAATPPDASSMTRATPPTTSRASSDPSSSGPAAQSSSGSTRDAPPASPGSATATGAPAPPCCKDRADLEAHDGKRVTYEGVYKRVAIMKRGGDDAADKRARTVQIVGDGSGVMLEIYYSAKGRRDLAEIERFQGKKVRVVGVVKKRTPDQMHGDIPMQTMTDPCIVDIESITEA